MFATGRHPLLHRPHALRRVVTWRIDERGDLMGIQVFGGKRNEKPTKVSLAHRRIEPPITRTFGQDHRRPVANLRHELVWWADRDGPCGKASPLLAVPHGRGPYLTTAASRSISPEACAGSC